MPLLSVNSQPIDSLKALYGSALPGADDSSSDTVSPDVYGPTDSGTLYKDPGLQRSTLLPSLKSDAEDQLFRAQRSGDTNAVLAFKGLADRYGSDISDLNNPINIQRSQLQAQDTANKQAQIQGYGMPGQDAIQSPSAQAAGFGRQMDITKIQSPLAVEQAKGAAAIALERAKGEEQRRSNLEDLQNMLRINQTQSGSPDTSGQPAQNPGAPTSVPPSPAPGTGPQSGGAAVPKSQSLWSFLTGQGAAPYSSLGDTANAAVERFKAGIMPSPMTPLVQRDVLGSLTTIEGILPGIRGVGQLLPKVQEAIAAYGKESPTATLQKYQGMLVDLNDADQEMNGLAGKIKVGANGRPVMAQDPQTIMRAKQMLNTTRSLINRNIAVLRQQYGDKGGLDLNLQQSLGMAPNPGQR